jgi:predicted nucleic acid binding AN1-type Zn finger protein
MPKPTCAHVKCNKKITTVEQTIGKCRCNQVYCMAHRLPELHDCSFVFSIDKDVFISYNKCVEPKMKFTICSSEH